MEFVKGELNIYPNCILPNGINGGVAFPGGVEVKGPQHVIQSLLCVSPIQRSTGHRCHDLAGDVDLQRSKMIPPGFRILLMKEVP